MLYTLENAEIRITASPRGGELHTITSKKTGTEYLWNADPAYWKYHAPILFPIVGRVTGGKYRVDGKPYALPSHGFARTSDFTLLEATQDSIAFELKDSEESLKVYPYCFALRITYTLAGSSVTTTLEVSNQDTKPLLFSIGAHPAFMCPINPDETLDDCYLEFSEKETASIMSLAENGFISRQRQAYLQNDDQLALKKELFHNDALIFDSLKSECITIKSKKSSNSLSLSFTDFPYFGIWAPKDGAPFLCLEPWQGHTDYDGFNGELKDKAGIISLGIGETVTYSYKATINE